MKKRRIKIGDRVRIVEESWTNTFDVGDILYVVERADVGSCPYFLAKAKEDYGSKKFAPFTLKYELLKEEPIAGGILL